MSLQTTAMADARKLYGQQLGSLGALNSQAGNVAGVASGLAGTGGGLLGQYNDSYAGLVNSMPGMSQMPLSDYVNGAANDVAGNFDRSRGIMGRDLSRMGINANSGRFAGLLANLSRQEAAQRAGAMTAARITGQRENFGRGLQASELGLRLAGMGIGAQQSAGGLYGAAGSMYGQAAGQYGNAANEAGQVAGQESMADQLAAMMTPAGADTSYAHRSPSAAEGQAARAAAAAAKAAASRRADDVSQWAYDTYGINIG